MSDICLITCLLALSASTKADGLYGTEVYAPGHASVDYYAYPRYAFEYAVRDPHTGDNKAQWEKRDGDVVTGAYSLVEPDGSLRVVEYRADDKTGFNAVVKRIGPNLHPVSTPIYKAPLPIIGYKSEAPISIGPVAGLEKLASAPLLNGPYLGGHASSYSTLYKSPEPSIIKEVIKEPIIPIPIIKEPIVPYPIIKEPYLPIYKESIYNPASILKEPIIQRYKSPIYTEPYLGPIVKQPWLSAPLYPSYPALKGPLLAEPRLYEGYPSIKSPILPEPRLYGGYSAIKDPLLSERLYGGYPEIKAPVLPLAPLYGGYDLGLIGKGLIGDKGLGLYDVKDYKGYAGIGQGH